MSSPPIASVAAGARAVPAGDAGGYASRSVEAYAYATEMAPPARLTLHPLPTEISYSVVSFWEERLPDQVQRTTLQKNIRVVATRQPIEELRLRYEATTPIFQKPDVTSFERVLLLLASLYQNLELRVTRRGQVTAVLNDAELQHTWEQVQAELVRRSGGEDEFTRILLNGLNEQLSRPGAVLASLRLDYFFGFLLQNLYEQRFETGFRYGQARSFPQFFAGQDLWFWERLELATPVVAERVALRLRGQPDLARTDLAGLAQQMDAARQLLVPDALATRTLPEALCLAYEATVELDATTGWPVRVEASVRCGVPDGYGKEYFIRLEQDAPTP